MSISIEKAREIGMKACREKIGEAFAKKSRDKSSFSYGETPNGFFCFLGVDTRDNAEQIDTLSLTEEKFPVYASCLVDMQTGEVSYQECKLP